MKRLLVGVAVAAVLGGCGSGSDDVDELFEKVKSKIDEVEDVYHGAKECAEIDYKLKYDAEDNTCYEDDDKSKVVKSLDEDDAADSSVTEVTSYQVVNRNEPQRFGEFLDLAAASGVPMDFVEDACKDTFNPDELAYEEVRFKCFIGKTDTFEDKAIILGVSTDEYRMDSGHKADYAHYFVSMYNLTDHYVNFSLIEEFKLRKDSSVFNYDTFAMKDNRIVETQGATFSDLNVPTEVTTVFTLSSDERMATLRSDWYLRLDGNADSIELAMMDGSGVFDRVALDQVVKMKVHVDGEEQGTPFLLFHQSVKDVLPLFQSTWLYQ
ncbi:hypothetical protein L1D22_00285 [Vibrio sp. Isolate34]|uniref:hypothetical protein n=1 Tax=Vibrio sp. Isolate34 TaxID=2908540 RepID=UPI001EFCF7F4|nr:hypothetical protein [Vibrio sp. Isolate34]MCG9638391.1 hypothetical protein [Vibrio sp. Isolate34]